jgi:hypothetical protein
MYEFDSVSVSTYEAASLAAKLSERSADGWEVVAIVPAGSDITAYVKRSADGAATSTSPAADATIASSAAAEPVTTGSGSDAVSEPSGWGTAPEAAAGAGASSWGQTATTETPTAESGWGSNSGTSTGWGSGAAEATPAATAPAQPATPSVPAGWYHDPAGRYELRYWDGSAWTEHVSRNGQQYTDPPVA